MTFCFWGFLCLSMLSLSEAVLFLPNDKITGGVFSHSFHLFESCDLHLRVVDLNLLKKKFNVRASSFQLPYSR